MVTIYIWRSSCFTKFIRNTSSKTKSRYKLGIPLVFALTALSDLVPTIEFEVLDRLLYYNYMNRHGETLSSIDNFIITNPNDISKISYSSEYYDLEIYSNYASNNLLNEEQKVYIKELMKDLELQSFVQLSSKKNDIKYTTAVNRKTYYAQDVDTSINSPFILKL